MNTSNYASITPFSPAKQHIHSKLLVKITVCTENPQYMQGNIMCIGRESELLPEHDSVESHMFTSL